MACQQQQHARADRKRKGVAAGVTVYDFEAKLRNLTWKCSRYRATWK
jgi:hypothetical protein